MANKRISDLDVILAGAVDVTADVLELADISATASKKITVSALRAAMGLGASGALPIASGGTGSTSQNFVDLTTTQTAAGAKTFSTSVSSPFFGNATGFGLRPSGVGSTTGEITVTAAGNIAMTSVASSATLVNNSFYTPGGIAAMSNIFSGANVVAASGSALSINGRLGLRASADGEAQLRNNGNSANANLAVGNLVSTGYTKTAIYTFATLPAAATAGAGARAFISDCNQSLAVGIGSAAAGGGAQFVPVFVNAAATGYVIG